MEVGLPAKNAPNGSCSSALMLDGPGRACHQRRLEQIELANLWQTAIAGSVGTRQGHALPRLACWFVVEPPAGIEPATPSLPSMRR